MSPRTRPAQFALAAVAALAAGFAGFSSGPARAAGSADLSVVVTQSGPATSGGRAQFVVSVTNHGPEVATQATSTGSINVSLNGVNSATATVATPSPDVQLGGSASDRSPAAGSTLTLKYQVRVGKSPAPDVTLGAELGGLAFVSADAPCTVDGSSVDCVVGNLPAGSSTNVTLTVVAPSTPGVSATVTATAGSANGDSNLSNNSTVATITTR